MIETKTNKNDTKSIQFNPGSFYIVAVSLFREWIMLLETQNLDINLSGIPLTLINGANHLDKGGSKEPLSYIENIYICYLQARVWLCLIGVLPARYLRASPSPWTCRLLLHKGSNQGEGKEGKRKLSKGLAQMAAQQAAIRKMTEELGNQLNEDGSGQGNGVEQIAKEMEEIEKDIVNGELDQLTLDRQRDILTRLLQAENAERIRGEKEERESKTARENPRETPPSLEDYERRKAQEIELLRTVPADLTPYYKQKVNDYFNTLDSPERE